MKKCFLVSVSILVLSVACIKTQTKNAAPAAEPENSRTAAQTSPTPAQTFSEMKRENLDLSTAEKVSFGKLPPEIIAYLAQFENRAEYADKNGDPQSYPADSPEWYNGRFVQILSKDLNGDGVPEKIVVCDDGADYDVEPTAYFFTLKDKKWSSLQSGSFGSPKTLELLSDGEKNQFAVIGYGGERKDADGKMIKFVGYWRVEDGQYKRFECRETKESVEKIVPCEK